MRRFALVLSLVPTLAHAAPPPPEPPLPPQPPQNVPPTQLETQRIAGEKQIVPDDVTKVEIQRSGKDKIVGAYKLCITAAGSVQSVAILKSTGFPAYDTKITTEMQRWKYRPYLINGKATPVCTAITFIYSQQADAIPTIPEATLAKLRRAGDVTLTVDRFAQAEIRAAGHPYFEGVRTVCFTAKGDATVVDDRRSSFWRVEVAIDKVARGWAFRPYVVKGVPTAGCGTLRLRYDLPRDAPAMIDGGVMHTLLGGKSLGPRQASAPRDPKGGDPWERGKDATALVCIDAAGTVTHVELASHMVAAEGKGDGFADPADDAIAREIRTWRARPHTVNGKAQPACARVKVPFGP